MEVEQRWQHLVREVTKPFLRKAIVAEGARPQEPDTDQLRSWFGRVEVGLPGEVWPEWNGKPMVPLLQLNCAELPFPVEELADIEVLTVFGTRFNKYDFDLLPNGAGWTIRSYSSREKLVPLKFPIWSWKGKAPTPSQICWNVVDDLPCRHAQETDDWLRRYEKLKFGGWPTSPAAEYSFPDTATCLRFPGCPAGCGGGIPTPPFFTGT